MAKQVTLIDLQPHISHTFIRFFPIEFTFIHSFIWNWNVSNLTSFRRRNKSMNDHVQSEWCVIVSLELHRRHYWNTFSYCSVVSYHASWTNEKKIAKRKYACKCWFRRFSFIFLNFRNPNTLLFISFWLPFFLKRMALYIFCSVLFSVMQKIDITTGIDAPSIAELLQYTYWTCMMWFGLAFRSTLFKIGRLMCVIFFYDLARLLLNFWHISKYAYAAVLQCSYA